ncbi:fumarylacetoacetate hydrolase family protein [Saprospiraceae bacterium]|nr:fumarylacetoacetate hydrolase family protein [Saprospiraceae bacterium]MDA9358273.1 fumarylacetoacetate hydrolase family protein [Saprospiraceae bacterium]MDA9866324.1 fumarylacetoacetate hydrolase family protein [Saprospiraceae bacterium]MDB4824236.1 fumarylacetoacetate hydrolase family protein [Saprospiraceae bacterium]
MKAKDYAAKLRQAQATKIPISPLRDDIGEHNEELAYAIQQVNTNHKLVDGARIVGKKIGLTSIKVQEQFGISTPDFGILFDDMEVLNGLSLPISEVMQPKIEGELAFVLGGSLDNDNLTIVDIINSIDYVLPSLEIVGSRIDNWNIRIADTVADNASASHYVLGHTPKMLDDIDIVNCKMNMTINGELKSSGIGKDCLGSPLNAVLWLARKMQAVGQPLQAGELILSGSLGPMVVVNAGDHVDAEFEGLGSVSISFT